ncbi:MAG: hypothetical protein HYZ34_14785 [Ignavibacteriae bacterium]|nr:hypothetical protein [Ignavibacteriota bacterium]
MKTFLSLLLLLVFFVPFTDISAQYGIPKIISFQGMLTRNTGSPVTNGTYKIQFSIYSVETGGTPLWTTVEPHLAVKTKNGSFTTLLGNVLPDALTNPAIELPFNEQYWLEMNVRARLSYGEPNAVKLYPRIRLTTSPYAFSAQELMGFDCIVTGEWATAGGTINSTYADFSVIAGGTNHEITSDGINGTIGGGVNNRVENAQGTISGGLGNVVSGEYGSVGGGEQNEVRNSHSTITGGLENVITDELGFIGGGINNRIQYLVGTPDGASTIGGGGDNLIYGSAFSLIGGGSTNTLKSNSSAITGGVGNRVLEQSDNSIIGGGESNTIKSTRGVIAGGANNTIDLSSARSFIGGGTTNTIISPLSTISGGSSNIINEPTTGHSTIGGGYGNQIFEGYGVIGGGSANTIEATALNGTIGGGDGNNMTGFVGTISGGEGNTSEGEASTISGGESNTATGDHSMIPGGLSNTTVGTFSLAAGRRAKSLHDGSFVWADHTDVDFPSTGADQFLIRASGGVGIGTNSPTNTLHVNGTARIQELPTTGNPTDVVVADADGKLYRGTGLGAGNADPEDDWVVNGLFMSPVSQVKKVGIGIANPDYDLHLYNPDALTPTSTQLKIETDDDGGNAELLLDRGSNVRAAQMKFLTQNNTVDWYAGMLYYGGSGTDRFAISKHNDLNVDDMNTGGRELVLMKNRVGIKTINPTSTLHINGSVSVNIVTTSNDITLDDTHHYVSCTGRLLETQIVTLPPASSAPGREYLIKGSDLHSVVIHSNGGLIDGQTTKEINNDNTEHLISDGTNWISFLW